MFESFLAGRKVSESPVSFESRVLTPAQFSLFLALVLIAVFYKVILAGESFIYRDFGVLAYPTLFYHRESFWNGELPLWNPLSNCGVPFLAQWGTMALYPLSLIYLLLPVPWSVNFFVILHLFLAGLGIYHLAKSWFEDSFAASIASFAFVFNGITLSSLMWPNYVVALGWMPWIILMAEKTWRENGNARTLIIAAILAALQILSGVPELIVFTWLFIILRALSAPARGGGVKAAILRTGLLLLLVSGLTAIQTFPFYELLAESQRSTGFTETKWALSLSGLANFIVPLFRCYLTPQGVFFQHSQQFLSSTYAGIIVAALALASLCIGRSNSMRILAAVLFFAVLMALGETGGLYPIAKELFPFVGMARYPVKYLYLVLFAASILAGYGSHCILKSGAKSSPAGLRILSIIAVCLAAGILILLGFMLTTPHPLDQWTATWKSGLSRILFLAGLIVCVRWWTRSKSDLKVKWVQISILALITFDALTHTPNQNPSIPSSALIPGVWQAENNTQTNLSAPSRAFITPQAEEILLNSRVANLQNDFLGKRLAIWSNLNLLENQAKINGSATLRIRTQAALEKLLYSQLNSYPEPLLDFLSASRMTAPGQVVEWTNRNSFLPIVTLGQKPVFMEDEKTIDALFRSDFNPETTVYLPIEAQASVRAEASPGKVLSYQFSPHQIEVEVEATKPTMLVIAQSFYSPWRSYINDQPSPLWRANYAFQACEVPGGRSRVVLRYEDKRFRLGLLITAISACLAGGIWWRCQPRREI